VNAPRKPIKLIEIEEAPLGGGGGISLIGDGVARGGDSSPEGAGDGVATVGGGGGVLVSLVFEPLLLSANTTSTSFSFLTQRSLSPLMK
jgi:hypothetical protein